MSLPEAPMEQWPHWLGVGDAEIGAWVEHPICHRRGRCDRCGKTRFFLRLYDVWPYDALDIEGFGWVCADCLIVVIGFIAEQHLALIKTLRAAIDLHPSVTVTPARMPASAYVGGGGAENNRGEHAGS